MTLFDEKIRMVEQLQTIELTGVVAEVRGLTLLVSDLPLQVGSMVLVKSREERIGEVVGFDDEYTIVMLMGFTTGIRRGDCVVGKQSESMAKVGNDLLGRVINAMGEPIDGRELPRELVGRPIQPDPLGALDRVPIDMPLGTGVRCVDALLTVGQGQRLGIFAGPGIGKSMLIGQMAKNTEADVSVIALIGERGREVNDFLSNSLGEDGLARSVVVVATSDEPVLRRIRAAMYAMSIAEYFRSVGKNVVFFMDSITRFCQAQRQIGLAIGEPPATKGYTPSVFALLPSLLERCGRTSDGSITGFFAVLVEGDDLTDPISDAVRSILDGHVVLSRDLANRAHWPAIDVLQSVSRVANDVTSSECRVARQLLIRLLSDYNDVADMVNIGAYAAGSNPDYDIAIAMKSTLDQFLQQRHDEIAPYERTIEMLFQLTAQIQTQARNLAQQNALHNKTSVQ